MKRLEVLLTKCKETIKANKERTQQLVSDKEAMQKQLELKTEEHDLLKVSHSVFDILHNSLLSVLYFTAFGKQHFKQVLTSPVLHLLTRFSMFMKSYILCLRNCKQKVFPQK